MALYVERQSNKELSEHLTKALPTAAALRTIAAVRKNRSAHHHDAAALHLKSAVADKLRERVHRMKKKPEVQQRLRTGQHEISHVAIQAFFLHPLCAVPH